MAYTPNANRQVRGGKAMVSAKELADFKEQYGAEKDLTDLLNMDKNLQRKIPSSTMKSVRNKINKEQGSPASRGLSDPNVADKTRNLMSSVNIPEPLDSVPGQEYKKGGSVSASRRGDGCAQRGKTKGRLI